MLHHSDDTVAIYHGDCLDVLRALPDNSVDSVVTDPPYGLSQADTKHVVEALGKWIGGEREFTPKLRGFMSAEWDGFVPPPAAWDEIFRVLKPGGHVLVFAGSRTQDLMGLSCRLAGFEVRDALAWISGQGFPKSQNISKAIDKALGAKRPVVGTAAGAGSSSTASLGVFNPTYDKTVAATHDVERWEGWGTALKPANEPVLLLRKPLSEKTIAANVLKHGTGGLNIDASRVRTQVGESLGGGAEKETRADQKGAEGWTRPWMEDPEAQAAHASTVRENVAHAEALGRFPANVILGHADDCVRVGEARVPATYRPEAQTVNSPPGDVLQGSVDGSLNSRMSRAYGDPDGTEGVEVWDCAEGCPVAALDAQSGRSTSKESNRGVGFNSSEVFGPGNEEFDTVRGYSDTGGASRFFTTVAPDPSRAGEVSATRRYASEGGTSFAATPGLRGGAPEGRFPPNVVLDSEAAEVLDSQTGVLSSGKMMPTHTVAGSEREVFGKDVDGGYTTMETYGDSGGASRFFPVIETPFKYTAKAPKTERPFVSIPERRVWRLHPELSAEARAWLDTQLAAPPSVTLADDWEADEGAIPKHLHPYLVLEVIPARKVVHSTVKPLKLMEWLVTLITPPGGVTLDPFAGSGTTLQAARNRGFRSIGIERDADYLLLIDQRLGLNQPEQS